LRCRRCHCRCCHYRHHHHHSSLLLIPWCTTAMTLGTAIGTWRCARCACPHTNPFLTCWRRLLVDGSQGLLLIDKISLI
jgi:hypothetical protein